MLWFGGCVSCRLSFGVHGGGLREKKRSEIE